MMELNLTRVDYLQVIVMKYSTVVYFLKTLNENVDELNEYSRLQLSMSQVGLAVDIILYHISM